MRYLNLDDEIFLNQFSQNIYSLETVKKWFDAKNHEEKKAIILDVLDMVIQSHPTYEEISCTAEELKLSKTTTAVKLLNTNKPFNKFGYELADLPEKEMERGFILLLKIFSVADKRRRSMCCANGCHHWWHRDLSNVSVLREIKK